MLQFALFEQRIRTISSARGEMSDCVDASGCSVARVEKECVYVEFTLR